MAEQKPKLRKHTQGLAVNIVGFRKYMERTFSEIVVTGAEPLMDQGDRQYMVVSTHRSHLDYLLIASELGKRKVPNIRFAAGDNLTRLPVLGTKFIKMGAFSVYRSKASQRSYLFKLTEQVKKLILSDDTVVVFPEGGRSYTGHMLDLKSGITGAAVVAQQENPERNLYYLPVGITYEIPPEVPYFKWLLKGRTMRDTGKNAFERRVGELLYYAADAIAFIKRGFIARFGVRYGKALINFAEPIKVTDMVDVQGEYRENARNSFLANKTAIKICAEQLEKRFHEIYKLFPHNLVAYLLEKEPGFSIDEQTDLVDNLVKELNNCGGVFASANDGRTLFFEGLEQLRRNKVISYKKSSYKVLRPDLLKYFAAAVHDKFERGA